MDYENIMATMARLLRVPAPNGKKRVLHDWVKQLGISGWRWWDYQQKGLPNEAILKHFLTSEGREASC